MSYAKYTVIKDTREKQGHGWTFAEDSACAGTITRKLDTGDYSLEGYEDLIAIERKESVSELASNVTDPRFFRELERFSSIKYGFLVLEFYLDDLMFWPETSGIPEKQRKFIKVTNKFLVMKLNEIQVKYNIKIMFVGSHGRDLVSSLFKRILEDVNK